MADNSQSNNPNWRGGKDIPCAFCGKEVWRSPWFLKANKTAFCSPQCHNDYRRFPKDPNRLTRPGMKGYKHPRWNGKIVTCRNCNKELLGRDLRRKGYCSEECMKKFLATSRQTKHQLFLDSYPRSICVGCGAEFILRRGKRGKFCTRSCLSRWVLKNQPPGNEYLHIEHSDYKKYPPEFNEKLRYSVRKRDDFSCTRCGIKQRGLNVHHIDQDKHNSSLDNLISLCRSCHMKIHWELNFAAGKVNNL